MEGKLQKGTKGAKEKFGGEPLLHVSRHLARFLPARVQPEDVEAGGSRELPSVLLYPAFVALLIDSETADRPATPWVIRGSRPLFHTLGRHERPS
jgi:hypothetical protein